MRKWLAYPISLLLYHTGDLVGRWGWHWLYDRLMTWDYYVDTWGGLNGWINDDHG